MQFSLSIFIFLLYSLFTLPLPSYYFLYLHYNVIFFANRLLCLPLFFWHFLNRNSDDPSSFMWEEQAAGPIFWILLATLCRTNILSKQLVDGELDSRVSGALGVVGLLSKTHLKLQSFYLPSFKVGSIFRQTFEFENVRVDTIAGLSHNTYSIEDYNKRILSAAHYDILLTSPHGPTPPSRPVSPHYRGFTLILRHTKLGRTSLGE